MANFYRNLRACSLALTLGLSASALARNLSVAGEPSDAFTFEVSNVTANSLDLTITPTDDSIKYYWDLKPKETFDAEGGSDKVIDNHIAQWTAEANSYGDGTTWQEMMGYYLTDGVTREQSLGQYRTLFSGVDYVVYAFGMDPQGNPTTQVGTTSFTTLGITPSQNTFSIKLDEVYSDGYRMGAKASVTTSNADTYTMRCVPKQFYDKFDHTPGSIGEKQFISNNITPYLDDAQDLTSGDKQFSFTYLTEGETYYLCAVGLNEDLVPTTSVTALQFVCKEQTEPVLPSDAFAFEVSNVTANNLDLTITPADNSIKYYWDLKPKQTFDAEGGADKVIDNHIAKWTAEADSYGYGTTWQEMMGYSLHEGVTQEQSLGDDRTLFSGMEYVVYAFGMDPEGNPTTQVGTTSFTTVAVTPSQNTFSIKLDEVYPDGYRMGAKASVTTSNADTYTMRCVPKQFYDKFDHTPGSIGQLNFIANNITPFVDADKLVSGNQQFTFTSLVEGDDYVLCAVGLDENLIPTTDVTTLPFKCEPTNNYSIKLSVTDVTPMNAKIKIEPSDPDLHYYFDVASPEVIENHGGYDNIPDGLCIDWWKWIAEMYGGEVTWQEVMAQQLTSGTIDSTAAELISERGMSNIYWNGDWVLYAVGFDENGNVIAGPATFEFTTPDTEKSDLTFEFELIGAEHDEEHSWAGHDTFIATIDVYPSRTGENFKVGQATGRIFDQWISSDMENEYIKSQFLERAADFSDAVRIQCPGLEVSEYGGSIASYYLLAMGWNEGPTTPIYKVEFDYDMLSGLTIKESDSAAVFGGEGYIRLTGESDGAAVYSVSGQMIGAIRPESAISVPAGIYLVRYSADGKALTKKVMVK